MVSGKHVAPWLSEDDFKELTNELDREEYLRRRDRREDK